MGKARFVKFVQPAVRLKPPCVNKRLDPGKRTLSIANLIERAVFVTLLLGER
jgi:hypothetical protein